jgi:hypothetical protein
MINYILRGRSGAQAMDPDRAALRSMDQFKAALARQPAARGKTFRW